MHAGAGARGAQCGQLPERVDRIWPAEEPPRGVKHAVDVLGGARHVEPDVQGALHHVHGAQLRVQGLYQGRQRRAPRRAGRHGQPHPGA